MNKERGNGSRNEFLSGLASEVISDIQDSVNKLKREGINVSGANKDCLKGALENYQFISNEVNCEMEHINAHIKDTEINFGNHMSNRTGPILFYSTRMDRLYYVQSKPISLMRNVLDWMSTSNSNIEYGEEIRRSSAVQDLWERGGAAKMAVKTLGELSRAQIVSRFVGALSPLAKLK